MCLQGEWSAGPWTLKELNGDFIPTGPWLVGPIGGGNYPDKSKCPKDFLR